MVLQWCAEGCVSVEARGGARARVRVRGIAKTVIGAD